VEKVLSLRHPSTEVFRVCALGLTFKAGTDDRRDSPAVSIIQLILDHGVEVYAYDPTVSMNNTDQDLAGISIRGSIQDAARSSDLILLLTEWPEFRSLEPQNLSGIMRSKNVVDARNIFDSSEWRSAGFTHIGVGR
jgi:UDPglucose 6-dehydrogenase